MRFSDLTSSQRDLVVSARWTCDRRAPYFAAITFSWRFEPRTGGQMRYGEGWRLEFPEGLLPGELAALMIVAADSVERDHPARRGDRQVALWDLACWLESVSAWDPVLKDDDTRHHIPELVWPAGSPLPEDFGLEPNLLAEAYYAALRDQLQSGAAGGGSAAGASPAAESPAQPPGHDAQDSSAPTLPDRLEKQLGAYMQDEPAEHDHGSAAPPLPAPSAPTPGRSGDQSDTAEFDQQGHQSGARPGSGVDNAQTRQSGPTLDEFLADCIADCIEPEARHRSHGRGGQVSEVDAHAAPDSRTGAPPAQTDGPGAQGTLPQSPIAFSSCAPPDDLSELERVERQITDSLREHLNSQPGDAPGHLQVLLEARTRSTYAWDAVLERHFDEVTSRNDFGLGPRLSPLAVIYDRPIETTQRHLPDIALIGDVSGSMSGRREERMRAHMDRIRRQAHVVMEAFGDVELKTVSRKRVSQTEGHGGTDMDAVLREVQRRHRPEAIVLFTDGELPYWPRRPANNVIFVIVNERHVDVPGHIKRLVRVPWERTMAGPQLPHL